MAIVAGGLTCTERRSPSTRFTRMAYDVEVHPSLPATTNRPDFLISRGDDRIYVEAATVFSGIVDELRDGVKEGWIIDAANRGSSRNFYVGIGFDQVGTERPKDREIYEPLEAWLATLDPDRVADTQRATGELPEKVIAVRDWRVRFEAIPIEREGRTSYETRRLVGVGPVSAGFIDDKEQLRDTLKHKGARYGTAEAPVIVAVNCAGSFPKEEDIAAAPYGSIAVQYEVGVPTSSKSVRLRDGTWMGEHGPRGRRLSAVLTAVQLHPHTMGKYQPQLWHNPWARQKLTVEWPFTEWRCSEEGLPTTRAGNPDMHVLLDVADNWPGFERGW